MWVRKVLAAVSPYGMTQVKLAEEVRALADAEEVTKGALQEAIGCSQGQNWLRRKHDPVHDSWKCYATEEGVAQQSFSEE